MMNLSDEILEKVKDCAAHFLTPEEIMIFLDLPKEEFSRDMKNEKSPLFAAYHKGKIGAKLELRRNVLKMARHGSPQAEELADRYMRHQDASETEL